MKIESNKNWTTCLRLNTGDGSPRVFLLNSHFLGSVPYGLFKLFIMIYMNYTRATFIMFVVPLIPKGTPAVMITKSPS